MLKRSLWLTFAIVTFACTGAPEPRIPPAPTEVVGSEKEISRGRAKWLERMHRAAPGVDWRIQERQNHLAQLRARAVGESRGSAVGEWRERGSANQTGRNHVTVPRPGGSHPTGALLVGTSSGGLFEGRIGDETWSPRADGLGRGVHGLVVVPGVFGPPPFVSEAWIAIEKRRGGVFASHSLGGIWFGPAGIPLELEPLRIVHDRSTEDVFLLGRTFIWSWDDWEYIETTRVYRSSDGGASFQEIWSAETSSRGDLWIDRVAGGTLYLVADGVLWASHDGGSSFASISTVLAGSEEVVLAGSEAGAPTLYAMAKTPSGWSLYRSTNAGSSWSFRSQTADFWGSLAASISNPNVVLFGGVEAHRSTDGGATSSVINPWWEYYEQPLTKLHADLPGIDIVLWGGVEVVFFDTDGGTYLSTDLGQTVENITYRGFGNGQYYSVLSGPGRILAGSQDQGLQEALGAPSSSVADFDQIISGDYGHLTSTAEDLDTVFAAYPGFVLRYDSSGLTQAHIPPEIHRLWMPPLTADPLDPEEVYLAADHLWKVSFDPVSFTQLPHEFGILSYEVLSAFAVSPADEDRWYGATSDGRLWWSADGGAAWTESASPGPGAHYFYGSDLLPSPTDPLRCHVAGSGYSNAPVYVTSDGGVTWQDASEGLPPTLVFSLSFGNAGEGEIYAAAEAGPFRWTAAGGWESLLGGETPPLGPYWDVEAVPGEGVVRFASHGRGIWDLRTSSLFSDGFESGSTAAWQ